MKRTLLSLAAVALVLSMSSVVRAQDQPSSTPAATPATQQAAPQGHKSHKEKKAEKKAPKCDLNMASKEDLMKLPGVDDATADKIIAGRPYKSTDELVKKTVLTKEQYSPIKGKVMVKKEKSEKKEMKEEAPKTEGK